MTNESTSCAAASDDKYFLILPMLRRWNKTDLAELVMCGTKLKVGSKVAPMFLAEVAGTMISLPTLSLVSLRSVSCLLSHGNYFLLVCYAKSIARQTKI